MASKQTFALQNIHAHQVAFMEEFEHQGGISFLLIFYTGKNEIIYLPYREVRRFWDRGANGGRKSFRFEEIAVSYPVKQHGGFLVPYLDAIQQDLDDRDAGD